VRAVLDGAEQAGAQTELMSLEDFSIDEAIDQVEAADGVILGTPVYRASFAFPLKMFLDHLPRGLGAETRAPLRGKSVAILATGASLHHFLALNDLRNVLCTFFAAHVMPPGLYVSREAFTEDDRLVPDVARQAESQGVAIVELAGALSTSPTLRSLVPQA
jgi:FMN reductase